MVWATTVLQDAAKAALHRPCTCAGWRQCDHVPRLFEVTIDDPEDDPNAWSNEGLAVMGPSGTIVRELVMPDLPDRM